MNVKVSSEIQPLKKVLLHSPGKELENLIPTDLNRLLFDDIPDLKLAQAEHHEFSQVLRHCGVEVLYLENLVAEVLEDNQIKDLFIWQFIEEANLNSKEIALEVYRFLNAIPSNASLIQQTMAGITAKDLFHMMSDRLFIIDPMPNLYFTRDPFTMIGRYVSMNKMAFSIRNREAIYADFIFKYHPLYKQESYVYDRTFDSTIEGGDILILSDQLLVIGISQRTELKAIEGLARRLFFELENPQLELILALKIPNQRASMHLDTVFTQVHDDQFVIHSDILENLEVLEIQRASNQTLQLKERREPLKHLLENYLGHPVEFILCGGGDYITAQREQWSDGANTLCVKPGEVIVYSRNHVTNQQLLQNGIKIHEIPSSELSRGRGGARCMSMPLLRE